MHFANFSDGLLDVCIYKCASRLRLVKHSITTALKQHIHAGDVIYRQGKNITVSSTTERIMTEIDGDPGPALPVQIKVMPQAVNCIERDLDELLSFLEIPIKERYRKSIRRRIRTTNVIERSFREVRRRTKPMSCFTNEDSVNRIIYAILTRLNNKWKDKPLKEFTQFI